MDIIWYWFTWLHNLFSKVKLSGFGSKRFKTLKEAEEACENQGIKLVCRKRNHEEECPQKSNKCMKRPSTGFSATHSSGQSSSTGQSTSQATGASNVLLMVIRVLILLRGRSSDYVATMEWVMAMPGMLESLPKASWAVLLSLVAWPSTCEFPAQPKLMEMFFLFFHLWNLREVLYENIWQVGCHFHGLPIFIRFLHHIIYWL